MSGALENGRALDEWGGESIGQGGKRGREGVECWRRVRERVEHWTGGGGV